MATRVEERESAAAKLENEIAQVCSVINAATGRLVGLIARVVETGAWEGWGIRSADQWVAWKCGVGPGRARKLLSMARRLGELPVTRVALESGELSEDQVSVVCRHAPPEADSQVATLARQSGVTQLTRALSSYAWSAEEVTRHEPSEESRQVSFGHTAEGHWRLSARLAADEGALVEQALGVARQSLIEGAEESRPTWADALVAVADRCLSAGTSSRSQRDRHTLLVHLRTSGEGPTARLHLGPALPDALRRHLGCDGRVRVVSETAAGTSVSVGRAQRIVPTRTRICVEERDGGCRVPGCDRTRWLQVHHIAHWEDGGPTDTPNLVAMCAKHHRLHHLGQLNITGDADRPDGIVFTDGTGRRLTGCGRPAPPGDLAITGTWVHPSGESFDRHWVDLVKFALPDDPSFPGHGRSSVSAPTKP